LVNRIPYTGTYVDIREDETSAYVLALNKKVGIDASKTSDEPGRFVNNGKSHLSNNCFHQQDCPLLHQQEDWQGREVAGALRSWLLALACTYKRMMTEPFFEPANAS
jgi:hypothetical protein